MRIVHEFDLTEKIVAMVVHVGKLYVATERRLLVLNETEMVLEPIKLVDKVEE